MHDSAEKFRDMGARVEFGSPAFRDKHSINLDGKTHSTKRWVIATGSSPYIPPIKGLDKTAFITNRELFSLNHLPQSMIMLGAGPIATEMAQAFSRLGSKVHLVQRSAQILSKEDRDIADEVMQVLRSEDVTFHLDSSIMGVNDLGSQRKVIINNGEGKALSLRAETLLVAMGRKGNISELGLEDIGVEFDGKGIKVNRRLQTTQKHIYTAGNVTGTHLFSHDAGYEGSVVISNAIFHLPKKMDYTFLPWCTYTDPELASIGMNEKRAKAAGIEYSVWTEEFKDNDRSLTEVAITGKIKMIMDRKSKPIGAMGSASAAFFIGRTLGRDFAASLTKNRLKKYDDAIERNGFATVLRLRLIYFPFTTMDHSMGLTKVQFGDYFAGTGLGIAGGAFIITFLIGTLKEVWASSDWGQLISYRIFLSAALFAFSLYLPKIVKMVKGEIWKRETIC